MEKFEIGTLVKLKSSGPVMTVDWFESKYEVRVKWFDANHELRVSSFSQEALELVTNDVPLTPRLK